MEGREYQAIEQNAEKPSRWGQLAREGHQVVQFKDSATNKFVAVWLTGRSPCMGLGTGRKRSEMNLAALLTSTEIVVLLRLSLLFVSGVGLKFLH